MLVMPLGILAGALTTIAGLGGGMMLVLILSVVWDPQRALAATAPALLLGNVHRVWLFFRFVDRRLALSLVIGAAPAAFFGGLIAIAVPAAVLQWSLVGTTALAVAKHFGWVRFAPGPRALVPVGVGAGFLTATSGGGGLLIAPMLLSAGLRGEAYIATGSVVAVAMHIGRIAAYGSGGIIDAQSLGASALLALGIMAGNWIGKRAHGAIGEAARVRIAWGTMGVAVVLAVIGVT